MSHSLPKLAYEYDALEPYLDARAMKIHDPKHNQSYVDKLNKALEGHSSIQTHVAGRTLAVSGPNSRGHSPVRA